MKTKTLIVVTYLEYLSMFIGYEGCLISELSKV